jgi:hypothetical protein
VGSVKEKVLRAADVLGIPTTMTSEEEDITGFETNNNMNDSNNDSSYGFTANVTTASGSGAFSPR